MIEEGKIISSDFEHSILVYIPKKTHPKNNNKLQKTLNCIQ